MKVLHIINNLGSGGAEKLIEEMLPLLNKEENVEAEVLLLTDKNNVFDKSLKGKGIKVSVVPIRKIKSPMNIFHIRKHIIDGNYDIVHSHIFPTIYWASIASKIVFKNRPKFIYTEHSTYNRRRKICFLRPLEKNIYSEFDKIISISQSTQNNLIEWIKPKKKNINKFIVIRNGINIEKFKHSEPYEKKDISEVFDRNTKLLCMVGRFTEAKDQPTLIKAMKELSSNIHLLLIGEGPLKKQNEKIAKDIGVGDRVHFLGFRKDVDRILQTCNIIIVSSNWEGFSLAAIEGMATGKPLIVSNVCGLKDTVGELGLFFERGSVEELTDKINYIIDNNDCWRKYSKVSFNKSIEYDIANMVKRILQIYKETTYIK